ncbi:MAG: alpha/beta hydrolase [Caulobacteraceae bacterium]|nr:alpha/beta hydrolase [Caulobacteraceae bacterium]
MGRALGGAGLVASLLAGAAAANVAAGRKAEKRQAPRGTFVESQGIRLRYIVAGRGPPLVLVHGNGVSADDFVTSGLFDALAADHRVFAFDRPGFGYSPRPSGRDWSAPAQASLLAEAMAQLGLQDSVIIGHSWGAIVAANLALELAGLVRGLVLMSGYYAPTLRLDSVLAAGSAAPVLGPALRYTLSPIVGRLMAPALFRMLFSPAPVPERFRADYSVGMAVRPWQLAASAADGAGMVHEAQRLQARASEITLPVLLIAGREDKIAGFEQQTVRFSQQLPNAAVVGVEGAGHMVHYVATDEVASAIRRWESGSLP